MKKLENVLITGVTGSGKSVWVKSMMADIMKALSPEDVKFIVYDAKRVEFVHLKESRYWLKPVMTEAGEFARVLEWLKVEVEKRFQMFRVAGVDGIEAFNARPAFPEEAERAAAAVLSAFAESASVTDSKNGEWFVPNTVAPIRANDMAMLVEMLFPFMRFLF